MTTLNRRTLLGYTGVAALTVAALPALSSCNSVVTRLQGKPQPRDPAVRLTIAGAPAPPSALLVHMSESGILKEQSTLVEYESWTNINKLKEAIEAGHVHAGMASTSALAALKQQGAPVKLLDVFGWGILYVLAGEKEITGWDTLRGSKIGVVLRGSATDAIFTTLAAKAGLKNETNMVVRYSADPLEAGETLRGKQVQAAVLSEPWVAIAIETSKQKKREKPLYRAMDLQEEWGALIGPKPRIPLVGFFVTDQLAAEHPETVAALEASLSEAVSWAAANPDAAAAIASELSRQPAEVMADSLAHTQIEAIPANQVREELDIFFNVLYDFNPELVGGALPDESFYVGGD